MRNTPRTVSDMISALQRLRSFNLRSTNETQVSKLKIPLPSGCARISLEVNPRGVLTPTPGSTVAEFK